MDFPAGLFCYYHPNVQAASQCDECGDYLCDHCAKKHFGKILCPTCYSLAREQPVHDVAYGMCRLAVRMLAVATLLSPMIILVSLFIAPSVGVWASLLLSMTCCIMAFVVYIFQQPRQKLALSLALTNTAGPALYCFVHGMIAAAYVILFLLVTAGMVLGVDAWIRDDESTLSIFCSIAAPELWFIAHPFIVFFGLAAL